MCLGSSPQRCYLCNSPTQTSHLSQSSKRGEGPATLTRKQSEGGHDTVSGCSKNGVAYANELTQHDSANSSCV
eukprot:m.57682 g.57682  ORF g.57682 m.57682 type:complete len:73 (+) comp13740_c0_seq4:226-444(+)